MLIANAVRVVGEDMKPWSDARHADCNIRNASSTKKRRPMIEFVVSKCELIGIKIKIQVVWMQKYTLMVNM